jgi:hypothetical protein
LEAVISQLRESAEFAAWRGPHENNPLFAQIQLPGSTFCQDHTRSIRTAGQNPKFEASERSTGPCFHVASAVGDPDVKTPRSLTHRRAMKTQPRRRSAVG